MHYQYQLHNKTHEIHSLIYDCLQSTKGKLEKKQKKGDKEVSYILSLQMYTLVDL